MMANTTINPGELPRDLDGWPYRQIEGLSQPWRVTPCCGALAEYNNTGIGPVALVCKRCCRFLPEDFVDAPARLDPNVPKPEQKAYRVELREDRRSSSPASSSPASSRSSR